MTNTHFPIKNKFTFMSIKMTLAFKKINKPNPHCDGGPLGGDEVVSAKPLQMNKKPQRAAFFLFPHEGSARR